MPFHLSACLPWEIDGQQFRSGQSLNTGDAEVLVVGPEWALECKGECQDLDIALVSIRYLNPRRLQRAAIDFGRADGER